MEFDYGSVIYSWGRARTVNIDHADVHLIDPQHSSLRQGSSWTTVLIPDANEEINLYSRPIELPIHLIATLTLENSEYK